jgi:hypothetical protein
MNIIQNTTIYYTEELTIEIIQRFEIVSVSFPKTISQGVPAYFIAVIKNNLDDSEMFSLYINGKIVQSNINELIPGENRIEKKIIPTSNPYEFGTKIYRITLKDSENEEIARFYFKIIGIVIYFLNKQIKHKKLRR